MDKSVENCRAMNLISVEELERIYSVLYSVLISAEAEDGLPITETQSKIRNLTWSTGSLSSMAANVFAQSQEACPRRRSLTSHLSQSLSKFFKFPLRMLISFFLFFRKQY